MQFDVDYQAIPESVTDVDSVSNWFQFDITDYFNEILSGDAVNWGVVLRTSTPSSSAVFYSINNADSSKWPYLSLIWT